MIDAHSQHDIEARQTILNNIGNYGFHLAVVEPDSYLPGFAYSIGLFKRFKHAELICFGLKTEIMASILHQACNLIKTGETLTTNRRYAGFLQGYEIQFVEVDKDYYSNCVGYAAWFYDKTFNFPLLQLVWPDKQNNFPWEEHFNPDWKFKQPLLDRNTDFKFYEERNLGVYTTKQALAGEAIVFVYHTDDGDWQFYTTSDPDVKDASMVSLEEIVKLDPTINEVYHLPYGWHAWRESPQDEWQYAENQNK